MNKNLQDICNKIIKFYGIDRKHEPEKIKLVIDSVKLGFSEGIKQGVLK